MAKISELRFDVGAGRFFALAEIPVAIVVFFIVILAVYADLVPEAQTAGNTLNETGVPLGNIFTESSIVILLIMIGLLLTVLKVILPKPINK